MPSINILSTLEHLGPYGNAGTTWFGLTLQVEADVAPLATDERSCALLRPWLWKADSLKLHLWMQPVPAGAPTAIVAPLALATGAADIAALQTRRALLAAALDKDFDLHVAAGIPAIFDRTQGEETAVVTINGPLYRWPAHLAQITRYPYPIPHSLNLCFFFEVAGMPAVPAPGTTFFAAPEFSLQLATGTELFKPTTVGTPGSGGVSIGYSPTAGLQCLTQPITSASFISSAAPVNGVVLSSNDALVHLQTSEQLNWLNLLRAQCEELFDTSARLISAARDCFLPVPPAIPPVPTPPEIVTARDVIRDNLIVFLRLVLANLYRVGTLGGLDSGDPASAREASVGYTLFEQWRTSDNASRFNPADIVAIENELKKQMRLEFTSASAGNNFDTWLTLLRGVPAFAPFRTIYRLVPFTTGLNDPPPAFDPLLIPELLAQLDQLHLLFTQQDTLGTLLLEPWANAVKTSAALALPWASLSSFIARQNLRHTVAAANLRRSDVPGAILSAWKANTATVRDDVRKHAAQILTDRFDNDVFSIPFTSAISKAFFTQDSAWMTAQTRSLIPDAVGIERLPTAISEGVTLVLDTLSPLALPAGQTDTMTETSGFCLLGRRAAEGAAVAGPWRCLNLGVARIALAASGAVAAPGAGTELTPPTVLPLPLHDDDGLRHAMVSYNNQPMMMHSPAEGFDGTGLVPPSDEPLLAGALPLDYVHPSMLAVPDETIAKLPGLRFGAAYEFAAGRVRNCGALPAVFATPGQPGLLAKDPTPPNAYLQRVTYLRTVPVGALRFEPQSGAINDTLHFPAIPEDVSPRAREGNARDQPDTARAPLVLLSTYGLGAGKQSFEFSVGLPSLDLQTWDRYVADELPLPTRTKLWEDYYRQASAQGQDLSLDDPAVKAMALRIEGVSGSNVDAARSICIYTPPPRNPAAQSLKEYRVAKYNVTVKVAPGVSVASITVGPLGQATIVVPPGGVYRLTFSLVLEPNAAKKFAALRFSKDDLRAAGAAPPPYTMLIETVSHVLPSPSDVRAAFTVQPTRERLPATTDATAVTFSFTPNLTQPAMLNIGSATAETQEWRWNGRPLPDFPYKKTVGFDDTKIGDWEAVAFTPRDITDATVRSLTRFTDSGSARFALSEDVTSDPGVRYFRSRVIIRNRYGSLVPAEAQQVTSSDPDSNADTTFHWTRTLLPMRSSMPLPVPAVKLVLPLTQSLAGGEKTAAANATQDAASLLVVVQGPTYAVAGLAERMQVRVAQLPSDALGKTSFEYGPDPIEPFRGNFDPTVPPTATLERPVGHTYDEADIAPLWVNSSFVLPPIALKTAAGYIDARNSFAKVQFCRRLEQPYLDTYGGSSLESAWTDPYWVQFLPSRLFSKLIGGNSFADTWLSADTPAGTFTIHSQDGKTAVKAGPEPNLEYFLLLTEQVPDLLGRSGQERFVGICNLAGTSWALPSNGRRPASQKAVGRVLEVQTPFFRSPTAQGGEVNASNLLEKLFPLARPGVDPTDAPARITFISPPIYEQNQQACAATTGDGN